MMQRTKHVQPYHNDDAELVVKIHNRSYPDKQIQQPAFSQYLNKVINAGGQVWTITDIRELVGYGCVVPISGLDNLLYLRGCIEPSYRRKGYGSFLLKTIIQTLSKNSRFQLSHAVSSLKSPAAHFLQSHQFSVEHVEIQMLLENPTKRPPISLPPGFELMTYELGTAVQKFRQAYDAAFYGLPWYQPYTSDREVTADLENAEDLVFLLDGEKTAGFVWLQKPEVTLGEIEPIGILPDYQGRGLGLKLLSVAIQRLVANGATHIRIGTWQTNERATRLYQRVGFKKIDAQIYLVLDIT